MNDRWSRFYANVPGARETIKDVVREWFEQQLVETISGLQSLKGSKESNDEQVKSSSSEESLTTTVMPRYHVDIAVKRTLGSKLGADQREGRLNSFNKRLVHNEADICGRDFLSGGRH